MARSQLPFSSAVVIMLLRSRFDCYKSKLVIAPFEGDLARLYLCPGVVVIGYEMLFERWWC